MKQFNNSVLHMYTEMVVGKDAENQAGEKVKQYGGAKVMLVYGGGSIKKSGLFDRVTASLAKEGVPYVELGGVQPNPRRTLVNKGLELAKRENVDFLLGVGGGSAIDTAKAIAIGLVNDDFWGFFQMRKPVAKIAKIGTINTIAAAGSETSGSAVILDDVETKRKHGLMFPGVLRPLFAIINPELTYSVSRYQTAAGAADIFAHAFERYFNTNASNLADALGASLMRTVVKYSRIAVNSPRDYEARAELMTAAAFAHSDVTSIGRPNTPFTGHSLEVSIGSKYDATHGAGLSMLIPAYLERIVEEGTREQIARVAQFAVSVFDVFPQVEDLRATALEGVQRYKQWNRDLGLPAKLSGLGIPKEDLPEVVAGCRWSPEGTVPGFMEMKRETVERLYASLF